MADEPDSDSGTDPAQLTSSRLSAPGLPDWVKMFLIVGVLLVVGMLVAMVLLGGDHGPGRHG